MKKNLLLILAAAGAAFYYFNKIKKDKEKEADKTENLISPPKPMTALNTAINRLALGAGKYAQQIATKKIAQQAGSKLLSKKKKTISKFVKPGITPATYKPFAGYNSFLQPRPMAPVAPKPLVYFNIFDPKFKKP